VRVVLVVQEASLVLRASLVLVDSLAVQDSLAVLQVASPVLEVMKVPVSRRLTKHFSKAVSESIPLHFNSFYPSQNPAGPCIIKDQKCCTLGGIEFDIIFLFLYDRRCVITFSFKRVRTNFRPG
jgi:hypothetical protein